MNNNIDEELKKKIEKREKFDMILAYVLIGVLLICICIVLFIKFSKKDNDVEDVKVSYITASDITNSFNNSKFVNDEASNGAAIKASNLDNMIEVTYVKDNINLNYNIYLVGSELKFDYANLASDEEKKFIDNLYKEIAVIICKYYGNNEFSCKDTISKVNENNQIDGIRYTKVGDNNIVYVNARKSVPVINKLIYNGNQKIDINSDNYVLNIDNYQITDTNLLFNDSNINISGKLINNNNLNYNISILLKLYDNNNILLGENKYVFDDNNKIKDNNDFNISIDYNDFNKDMVSTYSFEIVK